MHLTGAAVALLLAAPAMAQEARHGAAMVGGDVIASADRGWAMLPAIGRLDADGDGLLSQEELGGTRLGEAADLDGDGMFSLVEISQALWARFDADHSGYLEPDEKAAMRGIARSGLFPLDAFF
jgi:hypothetical protein